MASDADDLAARLARIKRLTDEYVTTKAESARAKTLANRISKNAPSRLKLVKRPKSTK